MEKLILIANPGSASRKYALYDNSEFLCALHFEYEDGRVICTVRDAEDREKVLRPDIDDMGDTVSKLREILLGEKYMSDERLLSMIVVRIVAPGDYFAADHVVDEEFMERLEVAKQRAPLHVPVVAAEINHFRRSFSAVPIVAVSDSAFHTDRPELMKYYAFDTELADKVEIKRYGYHGLSVGYVVDLMRKQKILPEKLVVCHIGSGSSVTAVFNGRSMDTSMGYSPLEGLMMATRAGSIDVAAALALKRELGLDDDGLLKYLNKKAGLLGVSGTSDDMREVLEKHELGDIRAAFAHALYIYRIQSLIGQMVASLGGIDGLVFTATIGERSDDVRRAVVQKLAYLGFNLDGEKNGSPETGQKLVVNVGVEGSKPIYVIKTDETAEMIRRARVLI